MKTLMSRVKLLGQFFTPELVAKCLVRWAVRSPDDRILDPSCGDGEFLAAHEHAVGIELDPVHAGAARERATAALIHQSDFFTWADETHERFEAVVGNPPFIRYQGFAGEKRSLALEQARKFGAILPELTSSWAPFIAAAARLLKPDGRIAFVVPAEIGHASYAVPLIQALAAKFQRVLIVAINDKLFPTLSEDTWLLYASGYGGHTDSIELATLDKFKSTALPPRGRRVGLNDLAAARGRLRRWLLPEDALATYTEFEAMATVQRLGSHADVNIGYVSGANDFFHLRPSEVKRFKIPHEFLRPAVRKGASLPAADNLTQTHVRKWIDDDDAFLLLAIPKTREDLPRPVLTYLKTAAAKEAKEAYKCRVRDPWYSVPDVVVPDGFLTYMSGDCVQVIRNGAGCVATNSVHIVRLKSGKSFEVILDAFTTNLTRLSCEVEGHPLGGGMLKVEPREAQRILIPEAPTAIALVAAADSLERGIDCMRRWRGLH